MFDIRKTDVYAAWIDQLRDQQGRVRILASGGKSTQATDIKTALRLARNLKE